MPVQHSKQSNPGACVPACVRMVLAALGDEYTEARLAVVLGSYEFGTPISRVKRLETLGYRVQFGSLSLERLKVELEGGLFPIVFVRAEWLPWADFAGLHALVLTEITATEIAVFDPAQDSGPNRLNTDGFLVAWEEFDSMAAIISR